MFYPLAACPSWTQFTPLCVLDTQVVSESSRSSSPLLVAHDDLGYLPICQGMISLCHHKHSMETPRGEAGTVKNSSTSHVGTDFITDLPASDSHTSVFGIVRHRRLLQSV